MDHLRLLETGAPIQERPRHDVGPSRRAIAAAKVGGGFAADFLSSPVVQRDGDQRKRPLTAGGCAANPEPVPKIRLHLLRRLSTRSPKRCIANIEQLSGADRSARNTGPTHHFPGSPKNATSTVLIWRKCARILLPRVGTCLICFTPIVRNSCFALSSVCQSFYL
jgi:hypothetical protein